MRQMSSARETKQVMHHGNDLKKRIQNSQQKTKNKNRHKENKIKNITNRKERNKKKFFFAKINEFFLQRWQM